jgi:HAD superfamily hydrolase (TIGR01509 family)
VLRALIFDVDGTLAETEEFHRSSFNLAFQEAGLGWHWDHDVYAKLLTTTGGKERIARHIVDSNAPLLSSEVIAKLHLRKNQIYADRIAGGGLSLRPEVERLVFEAKAAGLRLGIATTTSRSNLNALLLCCFGGDAASLFNAIVCGEDVQRKKPDPQVYTTCLKRLETEAKETLAFEDSAIGLKSAVAAGLKTIVTPSHYTQNDDFLGAFLTVADLTDIEISGLEAMVTSQ